MNVNEQQFADGAPAHNAAGRAYTLARIYEEFADVGIIGSLLPKWGCDLWEPIRNTTLQYHSFVAEEDRFLNKPWRWWQSTRNDIVHLSKPRIPNIFRTALQTDLECYGVDGYRRRRTGFCEGRSSCCREHLPARSQAAA